MTYIAEKLTYKGFDIEICYDQDAEPDTYSEDLFLVYDHRAFTVKRKDFDPADIFETWQTKNIYNGYWIFPVYAYIHGGVSLSLGRSDQFSCGWDTSFKGFVLVKRMKGWSYRRCHAEKAAESLLKKWNFYNSGQVYGYNIPGLNESCWGYIGDIQYCIDEAKITIDHELSHRKQKHYSKLKAWIRNKVSIMYRESFPYQFT
jgi:hypothetical protein